MTYHRVCSLSKTSGASSGAGTATFETYLWLFHRNYTTDGTSGAGTA